VIDVFAGARTPSHLTSGEFVGAAAGTLAPGGVYTANVADGGELAFARSQVAAAAAVFDHIGLIVAPDVLRGRRFGNLVLVGSADQLPERELTRRATSDPFRARVLDDTATRRFARDAQVPGDRTATPSPMPPPGFFGRPPVSRSRR
jgi:hypothetical protein